MKMLDKFSVPDFCRQVYKRHFFAIFALSILCTVAQAQQPKKTATTATADVARGKYLVENVAMCVQCHTPRNGDGSLDRSRFLQGAPVIWAPANGDPNWPLTAPRIGGTLPASDADMVKLLTTGIWTTGQPLRLPMMPFRMNEADAKSVIAYLKSVSPGQ
jgi:mono/diheme cytochrome c family protein